LRACCAMASCRWWPPSGGGLVVLTMFCMLLRHQLQKEAGGYPALWLATADRRDTLSRCDTVWQTFVPAGP
jgi:hypothetical protein